MLRTKNEIEMTDLNDFSGEGNLLVLIDSGYGDIELCEGSKEDTLDALKDMFDYDGEEETVEEFLLRLEEDPEANIKIFIK